MINRDEWLKAIDEAGMALEDDQSAVTIYEFAELFGLVPNTAWRHLEKLVKAGKAERTSKRKTCPDGKRAWHYKAYRLLK